MTRVDEAELPDFLAESLGFGLDGQIWDYVEDGALPRDTELRLSVLGRQELDEDGSSIRRTMQEEIIDHVKSGAELSERAQELLYGDVPTVVLNFAGYDSPGLNRIIKSKAGVFHQKSDMAEAIRLRRMEEGKTIDVGFRDHRNWTEKAVCSGLAHGVWRALLQRAKPEWMSDEGVEKFWVPQVNRTHQGTQLKIELDAEHKLMRRRLVSVAAMRTDLLLELLGEAKDPGVAGIGEVGIVDMTTMLAEQSPELHPEQQRQHAA